MNKDKILNKINDENYSCVLDHIKYELNESDTEIIAVIKTLISVINGKDKCTYGHVERVVEYAKLIGDELKLTKEDKKKVNIWCIHA